MDKIAIVGVGNPIRSDDSVGWHVVDKIKESGLLGISCLKIGGQMSELLDLFEKYSLIYIIDAAVFDKEEALLRIDAIKDELPYEERLTSSHGMGLHMALKLGKELGVLPQRLIIYAIKVEDLSIGDELSSLMRERIDMTAHSVLQEEEIKRCMKKK